MDHIVTRDVDRADGHEEAPQRPLAVLHVIPSVAVAHGGPSRAIVEMETALAARGVRVTTLTTDDDGPGRRFDPDARPAPPPGVERVYVAKRSEFYKVAPDVIRWLSGNLRGFDVVHIHALFSFTSTAAARMADRQRVPYVVRPLGTLARYGVTSRRPFLKRAALAWLDGPILRRAAAVHFTSHEEKTEAEALGIVMNSVVIPLGIGQPAIAAAQTPRTAATPRRLLFMSRLDPKKNLEGLLDALARLPERHANVTLTIAGKGSDSYTQDLRTRARGLGLDARIDWLGHVDGDAKARTLAAADLFVLPSFSENFGIAAAEAMMAGLPCILGDGVALAAAAHRAGAALAVAPDPDAIAAAITTLCDAPARLDTMARSARAHADTNFSRDAMAAALVGLYRAIAHPAGPQEAIRS